MVFDWLILYKHRRTTLVVFDWLILYKHRRMYVVAVVSDCLF